MREYNGLAAVYIPLSEGDIVTQSGCVITSVQYYVDGNVYEWEYGAPGQCTPDEDGSYNYNWYGKINN